VDFFAAEVRIVVEFDGNQHYTLKGLAYDQIRTEYLEAHGLKVLRFRNRRIRDDLPGVLLDIQLANEHQISLGVLPFRE